MTRHPGYRSEYERYLAQRDRYAIGKAIVAWCAIVAGAVLLALIGFLAYVGMVVCLG